MKVSDLIAVLQTYDPSLEIAIQIPASNDDEPCPMIDLQEENISRYGNHLLIDADVL